MDPKRQFGPSWPRMREYDDKRKKIGSIQQYNSMVDVALAH